ncbi:Uncharacterised protein [Vibrio cholerae]|nr:Uncharacterised protein [Vibrio cholerae]
MQHHRRCKKYRLASMVLFDLRFERHRSAIEHKRQEPYWRKDHR